MRLFTIVLLLVQWMSVFSQDLRDVSVNFPRSPQPSEHYQVLRSNTSIKHGDFVSFFRLENKHYKSVKRHPDSLNYYVKQRGTYQNGQKYGLWTEYSSPGVLYETGRYEAGKKNGVWTTARENGQVLEKFDFDTRRKVTPEIRIPLHYPAKARAAGIQGKVLLQYTVHPDCSLTDINVTQSLSPECDAEATQILLKYYRYLKTYGPPDCELKTDIFTVSFTLKE